MELVIKIPDEAYQRLLEEQHLPNRIDLEYFIVHGIPLPKLFDNIKSEILHYSDAHCSGDDINLWTVFGIMDRHISGKENE